MYLMQWHRTPLKDALRQTLQTRPQVSPTPGFLRQLKGLELELFGRVTVNVDEMPRNEVCLVFGEENTATSSGTLV